MISKKYHAIKCWDSKDLIIWDTQRYKSKVSVVLSFPVSGNLLLGQLVNIVTVFMLPGRKKYIFNWGLSIPGRI